MSPFRPPLRLIVCLLVVGLSLSPLLGKAPEPESKPAAPMERVTFEAETPAGNPLGEKTIEGQVVKDLGGGNILLLSRGGRLWPIDNGRLIEREELGKPFTPFTQEEMAAALKEEFGEGFLIVKTDHYILCSEASRQYTKWAGLLFERLLNAFETLWDEPPLDVTEPKFPLCAIILKNKDRFNEYAVKDAGKDVLGALGYYSQLTNRMVMYDLTGGQRPRNRRQLVNMMRKQIRNVTVVVHEATHQVAFNTGIHQRLAPNPFWLVEGMAMFFETPDLRSHSGWRTVGALNKSRARNYREYLRLRHQPGSLRTMITSDEKFHNADTDVDAYSEAWAMSYFLIWARREDYMKYLDAISKKEMLAEETAQQRIAEFEKYFGDLQSVKRSMLRYLSRRIR